MPIFSRMNSTIVVPFALLQCYPYSAALANIIITGIVPPTIVATPTTAHVLQLDQMK